MPNHFSYQALNMDRQSFCHACSPSSLRRQLTSSKLWAISAFASFSIASTSSSMSFPPVEYSFVVCLRNVRLCLINSSILPSLIHSHQIGIAVCRHFNVVFARNGRGILGRSLHRLQSRFGRNHRFSGIRRWLRRCGFAVSSQKVQAACRRSGLG